MIPGANILNMALSVIARQAFTYLAFASRLTNGVGQYQAVYAPGAALTGSVQPVPRSLYTFYGLDFQKNYVTFFVSQNVIDVARDVSGDLMIFDSNTYQCVSKTNWFVQDGWDSILCVQVLNTPLITSVVQPEDGDYSTGDHLDFIMNFSYPVAIVGAPRLALVIGEVTRYAAYLSGTGTGALTFRYTVVPEDDAPDGISIEPPVIDYTAGRVNGIGSKPPPANSAFAALDLTGITVNA